MGSRYIANIRTPVGLAVIMMMLPMAARHMHAAIWRPRSCVLELWYEMTMVKRRVANQTGAVSSNVLMKC